MKNLNDSKIRQQTISRYLNGDTTLDEECQLAEFLSNAKDISSEEKDILLLLQFPSHIRHANISQAKVEEFDRIMKHTHARRGKIVSMLWIASAAAAIICVALIMPHNTKVQHHITRVTPAVTVETEPHETEQAKKHEKTEPKTIAQEKTPQKRKKKPEHTNSPKNQDISTSELLETINLLSEIGTDDIVITASSCNNGFIVQTATSNGPSTTYTLERCSDGSSLELKTQIINL